MVFNSLSFVIFFIVVFALYWYAQGRSKVQNWILLLASYFFYGYASWKMLPLLFISTILFYILGRGIYQMQNEKTSSRLTTIGVIAGIGLLVYFKYLNFFIDDSLVCAVKDLKKFTLAEQYVPCWRYFGYQDEINMGVKSFFGEENFGESGMYKGYLGRNESFVLESLATDTVFDLISDSSTIASFCDFVRNLTTQGVNVVLVKYPMFHPLQARIANLTEMDSLYHHLSVELDAPLLDYWNEDFTYDTTYYCNPSHMNALGAELFTKRIVNDLVSLYKK